MKDDRLYLIHISECIERIESYVGQTDKQEFMDSTLLQDAIIRNLQVLAESTQRLSDKMKESESGVDFFEIAGFRNVLVHDYLGIEIERVWNILEKDMPALKSAVKRMMDR
ncbi:MAG: HepT-like ribonuclease domain-containing protein [Planctomycetota bacterium]